MAPKGGVLLSAEVYARVTGHVLVEEVTGIRLKGIENPVSGYVLKGFT
jgi:class 3 adenylate cyclase